MERWFQSAELLLMQLNIFDRLSNVSQRAQFLLYELKNSSNCIHKRLAPNLLEVLQTGIRKRLFKLEFQEPITVNSKLQNLD